jgi:putative ABC transport system permease protein
MLPIWSDLRFASRTLLAKPLFTCVAILSLALGIGANTAIFSTIESALLRGLPYPESERLVLLRDHQPCCDQASLSPGEYLDYRNQTKTLSGLAAATWQTLTLTGWSEPQQLVALSVTPNYFEVLRAHAEAGRLMSSSIDQPGTDAELP